MLTFGYLGEINILSKQDSIFYGSVFFVLAFQNIYDRYAYATKAGKTCLGSVWDMVALCGGSMATNHTKKRYVQYFRYLF